MTVLMAGLAALVLNGFFALPAVLENMDHWWLIFVPNSVCAIAGLILLLRRLLPLDPRGKLTVSWLSWSLLGLILYQWTGQLVFRLVFQSNFSFVRDTRLVGPFSTMITRAEFFSSPLGTFAVGAIVIASALAGARLFDLTLGYLMARPLMELEGRWKYWVPVLGLTASIPVLVLYPSADMGAQLARTWVQDTQLPQRLGLGATSTPPINGQWVQKDGFPVLAGRDLSLIVIESYGHTLFNRHSHWQRFGPFFTETVSRLEEGGWRALSGYLDSPVFGGRSWLADGSLLAGVQLEEQGIYEEAVSQGLGNLSHSAQLWGYHSVLVAPGTSFTTEQWRSFYSFDQYLLQDDFGYQGPFFNFGDQPDQFAFHRAQDVMERPGDRPRFVMYQTATSHVPFDVVPEFDPSWEAMGDGSWFYDADNTIFENSWLWADAYPEGYPASLIYQWQVVEGYLERYAGETELVIIVGDHQPRRPIAEDYAPSLVPIHIMSREPEILSEFRVWWLDSGFYPPKVQTAPPMASFYPYFLQRASGYLRFGLEE